MTVKHSTLNGSDLHEPKGVSSAPTNSAYLANGSGSGTWTDPLSVLNNKNKVYLTAHIPNISAPGTVKLPLPIAGKLTKVSVVVYAATTTASDLISVIINSTSVPTADITIPIAGSATYYESNPTAANTFIAGSILNISNAGTSSGNPQAEVVIELDVS